MTVEPDISTLENHNGVLLENRSTKNAPQRETWETKLSFLMSCVSYAVGFGTIWRFPYLCYRNGGAVFLVPYVIFLVLLGMPMFFLEVSYGQFVSKGPIGAWRCLSPLFQGIGVGMVVISGLVCIYYNVILAWATYFLIKSFARVLPWTHCGNPWNTINCVAPTQGILTTATMNFSSDDTTPTLDQVTYSPVNQTDGLLALAKKKSASEEFWEYHVLGMSDTTSISEIGGVRLELFGCLVACWVVVFIVLIKGIKSSGRAVYVTSSFPYLVLTILLIRGLTLPGAVDGIMFYVIPRWHKLFNFQVWAEAAMQIFYSVGAAWGPLITMASYNKFSNNCYRDAMIVPCIDTMTSIYAGFVIFSILGYMAKEVGTTVDKVITQGPGLVFIVYPEVIGRLFLPQLWSILFFLMLFMVGIGSQFTMFQTIIAAFQDVFPWLKKKSVWFTLFLCVVECLLGIPCITQGGMYVLLLMDQYCSTFALIILSFSELMVISWIYGVNRFYGDIEMMIGYKPCFWWKILWPFVTPSLCLFILIFAFISHKPVSYGSYVYPQWANGIGWVLAFASVVPLPIIAIVRLIRAKGSLMKRLYTLSHCSVEWGPANPEKRLEYDEKLFAETGSDLLEIKKNFRKPTGS